MDDVRDIQTYDATRYEFHSDDGAIMTGLFRSSQHYFVLTSEGIYVFPEGVSFDRRMSQEVQYAPYKNATYIQYVPSSDTLDIVYGGAETRMTSVDVRYVEDVGDHPKLNEYRPSTTIEPPYNTSAYQFLRVWNGRAVFISISRRSIILHDVSDIRHVTSYSIPETVDYCAVSTFAWCESVQAIIGLFHVRVHADGGSKTGWCVALLQEHTRQLVMADFIFTLDYPMTLRPHLSVEGTMLYVFCICQRGKGFTGLTGVTEVTEVRVELRHFLEHCIRTYGRYTPAFPTVVRPMDDADMSHLSLKDLYGNLFASPARVSFAFLKPPSQTGTPKEAIPTLPVSRTSVVQSSAYIEYLKWIVDNYDSAKGTCDTVLFYDKSTFTVPLHNTSLTLTVDFHRFYGDDATSDPVRYAFQHGSLETGRVRERIYELSSPLLEPTVSLRVEEKQVPSTTVISVVKRMRLNRIIVAIGHPIARDHIVYYTPHMYFRLSADVIWSRPKAYWVRAFHLLNSVEGVELLPWLFLNLCVV